MSGRMVKDATGCVCGGLAATVKSGSPGGRGGPGRFRGARTGGIGARIERLPHWRVAALMFALVCLVFPAPLVFAKGVDRPGLVSAAGAAPVLVEVTEPDPVNDLFGVVYQEGVHGLAVTPGPAPETLWVLLTDATVEIPEEVQGPEAALLDLAVAQAVFVPQATLPFEGFDDMFLEANPDVQDSQSDVHAGFFYNCSKTPEIVVEAGLPRVASVNAVVVFAVVQELVDARSVRRRHFIPLGTFAGTEMGLDNAVAQTESLSELLTPLTSPLGDWLPGVRGAAEEDGLTGSWGSDSSPVSPLDPTSKWDWATIRRWLMNVIGQARFKILDRFNRRQIPDRDACLGPSTMSSCKDDDIYYACEEKVKELCDIIDDMPDFLPFGNDAFRRCMKGRCGCGGSSYTRSYVTCDDGTDGCASCPAGSLGCSEGGNHIWYCHDTELECKCANTVFHEMSHGCGATDVMGTADAVGDWFEAQCSYDPADP